MTQLMLIDLEPRTEHERNLARETDAWIERHPDAYRLFASLAVAAANRGRRFGVKALAERVRWEFAIERDGDFKVNNNHVAYIGRRLVQDHPALAEFIEIRKVRHGSDEDCGQ